MSFSKRYTAISIVAAAALVLYLAQWAGYNSLAPQRYLAPAPPYTAAIIYLVSVLPGPRSPDELLNSLPLMQANIPWRHQWPVLLLHAGAYDTPESQRDFLTRLRESAESQNLTLDATAKLLDRIEFVPTHHELPDGIPADGVADHPVWDGEWPAYHHMCAFFSYKIFEHPRIKDLTYYLRLDDDSTVRAPACLDPFEYVHAHNLSYAYRRQSPDMGWVTDGMWPFVSNYAKRHPAVESRLRSNSWEWPAQRHWPNHFGEGQNFPSYETNFDLVKVPRFRTPEMTAFLEELASEPRRFYWHRWGDAPVRLAEVFMFLDVEKEVHQMCEVPYAHKGNPFDDCECVPLLD
ncbi:glycolipid 2-alpha-mannosyltransferase-domain-containing protein [Mycena rosella]|uniref:Glycolipid 2-alpha-mannosyltransferase-domain-containing protein n=1 Tax=Mycena rosella TaxID=1033263 RepID=A0AAD7G3L6_MYCRO|nr:glycolipid 2-alpha-mannosyltransferase-domain-containing protein [Mycena rosella]